MVVPMGVPYRRRAAAYPGRMSATFAGRLHVIVGPMFAGKTEELLRRVGRARLAGLDVEVVSHAIDTRGDHAQLLTHTGRSEPADRKSTHLNSSHVAISYAVFCLKDKRRPTG